MLGGAAYSFIKTCVMGVAHDDDVCAVLSGKFGNRLDGESGKKVLSLRRYPIVFGKLSERMLQCFAYFTVEPWHRYRPGTCIGDMGVCRIVGVQQVELSIALFSEPGSRRHDAIVGS